MCKHNRDAGQGPIGSFKKNANDPHFSGQLPVFLLRVQFGTPSAYLAIRTQGRLARLSWVGVFFGGAVGVSSVLQMASSSFSVVSEAGVAACRVPGGYEDMVDHIPLYATGRI